MGHLALSVFQTLCFVHAKVGAEQTVQVIDVQIQDAAGAGAAFADVTAEPNRFAVLHLRDSSLLQLFDWQVDIFDRATFFDVAQVADAVGFKERFVLGRSVDEADVIVDVDADVLVIEALWSQTAVTMEVAILVAVFKVKALWRFARLMHSIL